MINIVHDMPPRWVIFLIGALAVITAYYWTWQFLKEFS